MKRILVFLNLLPFLFVFSSMAADKVVVIPLNSSSVDNSKLWGEGRPGVSVTPHTTANGLVLATSDGVASWDAAAAACPADYWVCSLSEVQNNVDSGTNSPSSQYIDCAGTPHNMFGAWVSDEGDLLNGTNVAVFSNSIIPGNTLKCNYYTVWCCANAN